MAKSKKTLETPHGKAVRYRRSARHSVYKQLAAKTFNPDEFDHVPGVVVFAEHETIDSEGRPQKYGLNELKAIARKCNERIRNTGDFAVITDGHTPEDSENGRMPEVIGFAGPFTVGAAGWTEDKETGERRRRYAIYAHEWRIKDDAGRFRKLPRRSVELWMTENVKDRFIDPIAALGAETPRLDLGLKFAKLDGGVTVAKYTAVAPSGANTFVPGGSTSNAGCNKRTRKKTRKKEAYAVANNDLIRELVLALEELDWVQFAKAQMNEASDESENDQDEMPSEDADREIYNEDELDDEDEYADDYRYDVEEGDKSRSKNRKRHMAGDIDADAGDELDIDADDDSDTFSRRRRRHSRKTGATGNAAASETDFRERYQKTRGELRKLASENQLLKERHSLLESKVGQISREREDANREREINRLASEYALDEKYVDGLREKCLYSLGSKMSAQRFEDQIETVESVAPRIPIGRGFALPGGAMPMSENSQRHSERIAKKATEVAERYRKGGEPMTYEAARAVAMKELGLPV